MQIMLIMKQSTDTRMKFLRPSKGRSFTKSMPTVGPKSDKDEVCQKRENIELWRPHTQDKMHILDHLSGNVRPPVFLTIQLQGVFYSRVTSAVCGAQPL